MSLYTKGPPQGGPFRTRLARSDEDVQISLSTDSYDVDRFVASRNGHSRLQNAADSLVREGIDGVAASIVVQCDGVALVCVGIPSVVVPDDVRRPVLTTGENKIVISGHDDGPGSRLCGGRLRVAPHLVIASTTFDNVIAVDDVAGRSSAAECKDRRGSVHIVPDQRVVAGATVEMVDSARDVARRCGGGRPDAVTVVSTGRRNTL
jgi:hypothetical protein